MLYILIPVFNEADNLATLHFNLTKALAAYEVTYVFVDDGSADNSPQIIADLFVDQKCFVLGDGSNHGPGYSFNLGFEHILKIDSDKDSMVVTIEADNTSDLKILEHMLAISRMGYSLVLASVYAQGGGFDKTSFLRKLLSSVANLMLRFVFNIKVQTLSSFYRVYHVSLLKLIRQQQGKLIVESGFLCMIEILIKAIKAQASIIEVPMVLYSARRKGKSKMKLLSTSVRYARFLLTNKIK